MTVTGSTANPGSCLFPTPSRRSSAPGSIGSIPRRPRSSRTRQSSVTPSRSRRSPTCEASLRRTVEDTLWQLVRSDILELDEDPRSPERGQYRFVQGLIREVAYGRLSKSERVARHLEVARRFEELRDIELAGVIAGHYAAAAAADPANVELVERARASVVDAAERAAALHSHAQAVALFAQAAAMTEDPAAVAELRLSAAEPQGNTGRTDLGIELAQDALEYFEETGDRDGVARAATMIAYLAISEFDSQLAVDTIVPVYEAAEPEDTVTWARLAGETSRALMLHEDSTYAVTVADQVLPVLAKLELDEELVEVLINKAGAIARHGRDVEGKALLFGAAEMARQLDYLAGEIRALNNLGSALRFETHRPIDLYDRLYALIAKSGNLAWTLRALFYRATNATAIGDLAEARRAYEELDAADSSDFWRDIIASEVALLDAWQYGYTAEIREGFEAANRSQLESNDPQIGAAGLSNQLAMEMMAGTPGASLPHAMALLQGYGLFVFDGVSVAIASAGLARDADAVAELRDRIPTGSDRHGYLRSAVLFADALIAALGDDPGAATPALEHFDEIAGEYVSDFELAMSRAVLADIVGVDDPVARRLATSAAAFVDEWGLIGMSDLFAGLFASLGEPPASAEAG